MIKQRLYISKDIELKELTNSFGCQLELEKIQLFSVLLFGCFFFSFPPSKFFDKTLINSNSIFIMSTVGKLQ